MHGCCQTLSVLRNSSGSAPAMGFGCPCSQPALAQTSVLAKELQEALFGISVPWFESQI